MRKKRRAKKNKFLTIFVLILFISIGFALVTRQLVFKGSGFFDKASWKIILDEAKLTSDIYADEPIISEDKHKVYFEVDFDFPGQEYTFTVKAKNEGSMDAMVSVVNKNVLLNGEEVDIPDYVDYTVTYDDNREIAKNHLLKSGDYHTYKVTVKYREDVDLTNLETSNDYFSFEFSVDYVVADDNSIDLSSKTYLKEDYLGYYLQEFAMESGFYEFTRIERANSIPEEYMNDYYNIAAADSVAPIYVYCTEDVLYLYTTAGKIAFREHADFGGLWMVQYIDFSMFDVSEVTDMSNTFSNSYLETIDISTWDTSSVTNMNAMFQSCWNLKELIVGPKFDTSKVKDMRGMFTECQSLEKIDLSIFDTSSLEDMAHMFSSCESLVELDFSTWDTSNLTDMEGAFQVSKKLQKVTFGKNFDTSKVTGMYAMFNHCESLKELDLSMFDTSSVYTMGYMFSNCKNLERIYVGPKFTLSRLTSNYNSYMFSGCSKLVGGNGTNYISDSNTYAKADGYVCNYESGTCTKDDSVKGYFTLKN